MHLLIVDDEPDLCWAIERMLQTHGVTISAVGRGEQALALVAQQHFNVAFIDAILPDIHGLQLAEEIYTRSPQTRLVIMSGYYYAEDRNLIQVPFVGFLAKPFLRADVRAMLYQALADVDCGVEEYPCHISY